MKIYKCSLLPPDLQNTINTTLSRHLDNGCFGLFFFFFFRFSHEVNFTEDTEMFMTFHLHPADCMFNATETFPPSYM